MRIDFSKQQYRGDDEQRLIRLMRAARAVAGTLFVVGLTVVLFKSPPPAADPAPVVASGFGLEVGPQPADMAEQTPQTPR